MNKRETKTFRVEVLRNSVVPCPQGGGDCGGKVAMGRDNIRHLGHCRSCGVVLRRKGRKWIPLSEKEWAQVGVNAVVMEFVKQDFRRGS